MLRTAASLAGLTAVFVLVLYLAYGSGGDSTSSPTPTSSALVAAPTQTPGATLTPSPQPTSTPSYLAGDLMGTSLEPLRQGDPVEIPAGVVLIIETGCWQCDGPTTGLDRVYRDPSGKIRTDTLVSAELLGLTNPSGGPPVIVGFDVLDDASWIVVAFCTAGTCDLLGPRDADAHTTFFESTDGGVTWSELADLAGAYGLVSLVPETHTRERDIILDGPYSTDPEAPFARRLRYLLSGEDVMPPAEAGDFPWPYVTPTGEILWQAASSRLVTSSGTVFFYAGPRAYVTRDIIADLDGTRWGIPWNLPISNGPSLQFLTLVNETGHVVRTLQYDRSISWGSNSTGDVMYGNAELDADAVGDLLPSPAFTLFPAEIHLNDAIFYPILDPFTDKPYSFGRNRVVAVQAGGFARVVNTEGSCLNVRAEPDTSAAVLTCAAEGVLLHAIGLTDNPIEGWQPVRTQDGRFGWASTEFLEY